MSYPSEPSQLQLLQELLSIASHELKTPLSALRLQLNMARKSIDLERGIAVSPEKLVQILDDGIVQLNSLTQLVEVLLDVPDFYTAKMNLETETVDLVALVKEVLDLQDSLITVAGCTLYVQSEKKVVAKCDHFRMKQVITNLLTNATKYGAGNPIHIFIQTVYGKPQISIQDFGIGIPIEKLETIFDKFVRVLSTSGQIQGRGLGLYISREILKAHGGAILVKSELGLGSCFTIELPAS